MTPERSTAAEQFELVVQRFGSQGLQLWKAEIHGLEQVRRRFPDDHPYAAKSMAAIQEIYLYYLNDPRRAVTAGQELIDQYPRERELCARTTIFNARACLTFSDDQRALEWIREAEDSYADITGIQRKVDALRQGMSAERQGE